MSARVLRASILAALALGATTAQADVIAESAVTRMDGDRLAISWSAAGPVDVFVGDKPTLDPRSMRLISDDDLEEKVHP